MVSGYMYSCYCMVVASITLPVSLYVCLTLSPALSHSSSVLMYICAVSLSSLYLPLSFSCLSPPRFKLSLTLSIKFMYILRRCGLHSICVSLRLIRATHSLYHSVTHAVWRNPNAQSVHLRREAGRHKQWYKYKVER